MKNKKWKLTLIVLGILSGVAVGFFIKDWSESVLWIGWFGAIGSAIGIFVGGNHLDKRQYVINGVDKPLTK